VRVFNVTAEITTHICSKKVTRKSEVIVGALEVESITVELLNRAEYLHKLVPRFITGKLRDSYKCSKVINIKEI
jgi:hypothetical protein